VPRFRVMERRGQGFRATATSSGMIDSSDLGSLSIALSLGASRSDRTQASRVPLLHVIERVSIHDYKIDRWRK